MVDGDRCVAILTEGDVVRTDRPPTAPALEIASGDVVSVSPDTTVYVAVRKLLHEGVRQLPVVQDGALVGMCTRLDALRVNELSAERELPQPGWLRSHLPHNHGRRGSAAT